MNQIIDRDQVIRFLATFAMWLDGHEPVVDIGLSTLDEIQALVQCMKYAAQFMVVWDESVLAAAQQGYPGRDRSA
jgi:hypothetical protein